MKWKAFDTWSGEWWQDTDDTKLLMAQSGMLALLDHGEMIYDNEFEGRFEVVRYTGLKDRNNLRIYEGAFVEFYPYPNQIKRLKGEVIFHNGCFGVDTVDGFYSFPGWKSYEVIGNIYQNPELLPKGDN